MGPQEEEIGVFHQDLLSPWEWEQSEESQQLSASELGTWMHGAIGEEL